MNRVLILNGPPRSGKDTLSSMLQKGDMFQRMISASFKAPLQQIAASVLGMSYDNFMQRYESMKDKPCPNGIPGTVRDLMIRISEEWVKPAFGKRYFGDLALNYCLHDDILHMPSARKPSVYSVKIEGVTAVFTDGGFGEEVIPFVEFLGAENVHIVRITRPGYDFSEDSRRYLSAETTPELKGCKFYDLNNDGTELELLNAFQDKVFFQMWKEARNG